MNGDEIGTVAATVQRHRIMSPGRREAPSAHAGCECGWIGPWPHNAPDYSQHVARAIAAALAGKPFEDKGMLVDFPQYHRFEAHRYYDNDGRAG